MSHKPLGISQIFLYIAIQLICHTVLLVWHKPLDLLKTFCYVSKLSVHVIHVCYSLNIYMIHIHIYNSISQTSWCVANCFVCHYAKLLVHLQTNGLVLQTSWYLANLSDWYMSHNLLLIYHRLFGMSQMFRYMYNLLQASHFILIVTNFCKSNLQTFMSQHTS